MFKYLLAAILLMASAQFHAPNQASHQAADKKKADKQKIYDMGFTYGHPWVDKVEILPDVIEVTIDRLEGDFKFRITNKGIEKLLDQDAKQDTDSMILLQGDELSFPNHKSLPANFMKFKLKRLYAQKYCYCFDVDYDYDLCLPYQTAKIQPGISIHDGTVKSEVQTIRLGKRFVVGDCLDLQHSGFRLECPLFEWNKDLLDFIFDLNETEKHLEYRKAYKITLTKNSQTKQIEVTIGKGSVEGIFYPKPGEFKPSHDEDDYKDVEKTIIVT